MGISHVAPRPAAESAGCQPGFHIHVRQAPGRGRRVEPALAPEKGAHAVGRTGGIHRPRPGRIKVPCQGQMVVPACVERPVLRTTWTISDVTCAENVLTRTGSYIAWK